MLYTNENGLSGNNSTLQTASASRNEVKLINTSNLLGREINVYGSVDNPLFLAKDVAEWIEYDVSSLNKLVDTVDDDEKLIGTLFRSGQNRQVWFLTEDGLYEVFMQSRKPNHSKTGYAERSFQPSARRAAIRYGKVSTLPINEIAASFFFNA